MNLMEPESWQEAGIEKAPFGEGGADGLNEGVMDSEGGGVARETLPGLVGLSRKTLAEIIKPTPIAEMIIQRTNLLDILIK